MKRHSNSAHTALLLATAVLVATPSDPTFSQPAPTVAAAADQVLGVTRDAYDYLHRNPELGKKEVKAHDYLTAKLKALGFTNFAPSPSLPTAVIAVLDTGRPGPTIALRSEMDARPLPNGGVEPASHSPRSEIAGVMHNCGHDAHAAILLGVAALIKQNVGHFSGKIVFLFQPAEETPGGADDIVRDGTLQTLGVQKIFAEHSAPGLPVGTIEIAPGDTLAGSNYFKLQLSGRSSHAAAPFDGDDVALGAMKVAAELSELPARRLDISNRPLIVSITNFTAASGASNVLPAAAEIDGTIRAYEDPIVAPAGGTSLKDLIVARAAAVSAAYGLTPTWIEFRVASPPTRNDPGLFGEVVPLLKSAFTGTVDTNPGRSMYSEDFAYYTPKIRSLYFSLGIAKGVLGTGGVHSADFTIHPDALKVGITLMTLLAEIGSTGHADWK
ncbi:MAG TPA: M20 family metallopeptidase [Allosphingosinicella sp.]|jgi:amidohydrolase|nr:M20 family metallopeptidase [Allosphingosinicella sp.]